MRYCVLISAIAMFVLSAGLLLAGQREARAPFTSWYALAMLLLAVGLFGIMIQLSFGSVVNWLGRTAQWLGGLYLLLAAVAALRESDLPLFPPEKRSLPERYDYGVAIAIVIAATAVRFALSPALGTAYPFLTFYPAVILAALYGGLRAGLLTTALSALIVDYFWIEPVGQFTIGSLTDWITILFFLLACTMISFAIEAMHKARARLVLHQDHLEELVKDRTAELEQEVVERKRAEEELSRSRDELELRVAERTTAVIRLAAAVESTGEGVFTTDSSWQIDYANPAFYHMAGYRADEVIGREMRFLRSEKEDPSKYERTKQGAMAGKPCTGRYMIRRKDGTVFLVDCVISPIKDASGTIVNFVIVWHDMSDQVRLEEQLRQAHKMEAIGTLAGGVAHDFNNMLAVIMGNAELALDDTPREGNGIRHNLDAIFKAARRGRDLVKQILTFSRKSEQRQKSQPLAPLIEESFNLLRASIPSTIEMTLAINTKSDVASVNEAQFQQIIVNLCSNAAHAMQAGGLLEISLEDERLHFDDSPDSPPRRYLKLTVSDTGAGMDEEVKKRIFDPFFTTKAPGEGTGMGLAVVYGIVEAHNGIITVHSEPDKGSSFSVFLPKAGTAAPRTEAPEGAVAGGKERLMFVDDEDGIIEMATPMLERLGYRVASFTDPVAALNAFAKAPLDFDLIITDQTMPRMTGLVLAGKLKAIRPDIPVMLCTGYSQTVSAETTKAAGIEGYAMKPLARKELAEAIRKALDQGGLHIEPG